MCDYVLPSFNHFGILISVPPITVLPLVLNAEPELDEEPRVRPPFADSASSSSGGIGKSSAWARTSGESGAATDTSGGESVCQI